MAIVNRVAELSPEIAAWRRTLHQTPELMYEVHKTAAFVAEKLKAFGCDEVATGIGRTGVVGVIRGAKGPGRTIGLRADMDALPIQEARDLPYKSQTPGAMHACGHDGHTAMLLGTARYLAETRGFSGTAIVIFQPAEEGGAGGKAMVDDGVMERFGVDQVFGMHNAPGLPVGSFATRIGPLMASTDTIQIEIVGRGGHAAKPDECLDPVVIGAEIVGALQTIASRNVDPLDSVVVSITQFNAGSAFNIIPDIARLAGTIRTLKKETREFAKARVREIAEGVARLHRAEAKVEIVDGYPVTVNHARETELALSVAREVAGADKVNAAAPPVMGAEDFAYMLEARPGAFVFVGNGTSAGLHHPEYDFNDEAIPYGVSYFARLIEKAAAA